MANSPPFHYYVEGSCEKKLIDCLKTEFGVVVAGKVDVLNVTCKKITITHMMTLRKDTTVVLVYDTDRNDPSSVDQLRSNIAFVKQQKHIKKIVCVPQVENLEDELKRSCGLKSIKELTASKSTKDYNQYAEYLLGKLYLTEDGIPKNAAKAVYYLNAAAEQSNQWAYYQLGKMLLYGKEVEQDTERGLNLLNEASRQGNVYADRVIENYFKYRDHYHSNAKIGAVLGSLRLLGHLARIMKNSLDEENRRDGESGLIDRKLRRQIAEKKQNLGIRM